jgi:hypothetical protein
LSATDGRLFGGLAGPQNASKRGREEEEEERERERKKEVRQKKRAREEEKEEERKERARRKEERARVEEGRARRKEERAREEERGKELVRIFDVRRKEECARRKEEEGGKVECARKEKRSKKLQEIYEERCARKKEVLETTATPHNNDVLCGNGQDGIIKAHPGNENFRKLVDQGMPLYVMARSTHQKKPIVSNIVNQIRNLNPPGRFLHKDANSNLWRDVGDEKARKKIYHALTVRRQLEDDFEKSLKHAKHK